MFPSVATNDATAVEVAVQQAYLGMFPQGDPLFVPRIFGWAIECFTGGHPEYQPIDALYHDFEHTLQGTLCMARLLHGRHLAGQNPPLPQRMFQLGLIGILLHDTGYLKKRNDTTGTGAKYTVVHVERSAEFAASLLAEKSFSPGEIRSVQNMIHCTGVDAALATIHFQGEAEQTVGHALGTADLLGQMAAGDYPEKLEVLFAEFAEAAKGLKDRTHFICLFHSARDLMQKTPGFWEKYVLPKLTKDFGGLYRFLSVPYPYGPNQYLQKVETNMRRIIQRLDAMQM